MHNDVQPLGKHPFDMPVVVHEHAKLSQLEIIDAKERVWANAGDFGISDSYRQRPIRYPIFTPKGYMVDLCDDGQQRYFTEKEFWTRRGLTQREIEAMTG